MKTKKIWPIILIVIIIATAAGVILFNSTDTARFRKQLNLGQRYLSEMNYEEAVVAFNQAIEIDPRSVDAYLGLADAYIGLGDEEAALAALKAGYEATGDERLKARIDEMEAPVAEEEAEIPEPSMDSDEIQRRLEEIYEIGQFTWVDESDYKHFLTYDQVEAAYRPFAEELEMYLEYGERNWMESEPYLLEGICDLLSETYLHLGDMEKCLETRRRGYAVLGSEWYKTDGSYKNAEGYQYDEYGRGVGSKDTGSYKVYGDGDYVTESAIPGVGVTQYEYDGSGRIIRRVEDQDNQRYEFVYEYQGDSSVVIMWTITENDGEAHTVTCTLFYNEYGEVLNEEEWVEAQ